MYLDLGEKGQNQKMSNCELGAAASVPTLMYFAEFSSLAFPPDYFRVLVQSGKNPVRMENRGRNVSSLRGVALEDKSLRVYLREQEYIGHAAAPSILRVYLSKTRGKLLIKLFFAQSSNLRAFRFPWA